MLIEFPTTLERTYTVVYSDNILFSNAMIAPPAIIAPANRTQWIDYGPPHHGQGANQCERAFLSRVPKPLIGCHRQTPS